MTTVASTQFPFLSSPFLGHPGNHSGVGWLYLLGTPPPKEAPHHPGSPRTAQDEVLLLAGPLSTRAWEGEAERRLLRVIGGYGKGCGAPWGPSKSPTGQGEGKLQQACQPTLACLGHLWSPGDLSRGLSGRADPGEETPELRWQQTAETLPGPCLVTAITGPSWDVVGTFLFTTAMQFNFSGRLRAME